MKLDPKQVFDNAKTIWLTASTKQDHDRFDGLVKTYAALTGADELDVFWDIVSKAHFGDGKWGGEQITC